MFKIKTVLAKVSLIAVAVCFFGCASSPNSVKHSQKSKDVPDWVTGASSSYPDSEYLIGVGYASTREHAESDAIVALIHSISQSIETKTAAAQVMNESSEGVSSARTVATGFFSSSEVKDIPGVSICENWTDSKGVEYALAVLDRNKAGSYYAEKAHETEKTINSLILYAKKNAETFEGYQSLLKAAKLATDNDGYLNALSGINYKMWKSFNPSYGSSEAVKTLCQHAQEKLIIGVYIDGDVDGRISKALSTVVSDRGFRTGTVEVSDKVVPYIMIASFELQNVELGSGDKIFIRYVLNVALTDTRTGKIILPYTSNGREAHLTEVEARQRAVRMAEKNIASDLGNAFDEMMKQYK